MQREEGKKSTHRGIQKDKILSLSFFFPFIGSSLNQVGNSNSKPDASR